MGLFTKEWGKLDPRVKRFIRVAAWVLLPAFILAIFQLLWFAWAWLIGAFVYFMFLALRWVIRTDRQERSRQNFDKTFFDDLRDIEDKVREAMPLVPPRKPKKNNTTPRFWNAQGTPMKCIMCDAWTNNGGRYCNKHDD